MVFDATTTITSAFLDQLESGYRDAFGLPEDDACVSIMRTAAIMAVETISRSDAFYHDVEHTMMVTLVGQEILRGKLVSEGSVSAADWLQVTVALLCHDIGYVHGICDGDSADQAVINDRGERVALPPDATDAYLTPYHIERGKLFVRSRFKDQPPLRVEFIADAIEYTRFPVPEHPAGTEAASWARLVQAADLIGQMADPDYPRKLPALYYEFEETGANEAMGNQSPDALRATYPDFFWNNVQRHIEPGVAYLRCTRRGRDWLAGLYSHVLRYQYPRLL